MTWFGLEEGMGSGDGVQDDIPNRKGIVGDMNEEWFIVV